jgi:hypothetical protein
MTSTCTRNGSPKPVQFNWRRHWSKKVAPYLHDPLVQLALDLGMRLLDPSWQSGDAPCEYGAIGFGRAIRDDAGNLIALHWRRIVKGKLSWYQPLARCHYIAFFAMAIGVLNYPDLDWRFVSGDLHTVPVGYDDQGNPRVVMDILLFDHMTADESIAQTQKTYERVKTSTETRKAWDATFQFFIDQVGSRLKARTRELRDPRSFIKRSGSARKLPATGRQPARPRQRRPHRSATAAACTVLSSGVASPR